MTGTTDTKRQLLNRLVQHPALKPAAKHAGIHPTTLFAWIKESVADPDKHRLKWLGHDQPFHMHVNAARKLNIVALDHSARDLAINGHSSPRFFNGAPVWKVDPKIASDALTMDELTWIDKYGTRPFGDTFARDKDGALVQECDVSPPNPAILVKLLTSLAPEIYGERSEVNVTHAGHVWIEGGSQATPPLLPAPDNFSQSFGLTARPDEAQRPTNSLAIPRPCKDSAEFDARFRKRLLREVVLFRDADNKLLPPFPDDVIVAGTPQARAFEDAGIEVKLVHPTALLDEGFENDWLRELAPNYKRKPPSKSLENIASPHANGDGQSHDDAAEVIPQPISEPPGKASARWDAENIGPGRPAPGGRRVRL